MAFQTGTSLTIENLMTQLSTFLVANGWTQNFFNAGDPGTIGFSKNQMFVSFQWSETADGSGTMAVYQARAADQAPTTDPWTATGDSGAGIASNTVNSFDDGLCVNNFAGPHTNYWFFEQDAAEAYVHVVIEVDAGRYRHFGFGELDKIGDWVGGEYIYGMKVFAGSQSDDPTSAFNNYGIDSSNTQVSADGGATVRVEGHTGEPSAATVWANFYDNTPGNDRGGNPRWRGFGGWRYSKEWGAFYWMRFSEGSAFKPMFPVSLEVLNTTGAPDQTYRIGFQPDVRMVNIANLTPAQIINIAGDNWYFFPLVRKQRLQLNTEESWNWGVAYKRVDA